MSTLDSQAVATVTDLADTIAELRGLEPYEREGRTARTLLRSEDLRVVLLVMQAGTRMEEHDADATVTVQALEGELALSLPEREVALKAGQLLTMQKGLAHDVEAKVDSAFLLTLGWTVG